MMLRLIGVKLAIICNPFAIICRLNATNHLKKNLLHLLMSKYTAFKVQPERHRREIQILLHK